MEGSSQEVKDKKAGVRCDADGRFRTRMRDAGTAGAAAAIEQ
jgi:hypothetical protein